MSKNVNKSEIIRRHLKNAADTSPTAVAEAIAAKGVKVSPKLVSVVKYVQKHGKRKANPESRSSMERHVERLSRTGRFVKMAGGIDQAKALLDMFGRIVS
jgi:hypothetical protein